MKFYRKWYKTSQQSRQQTKGVFGGKILSQQQIQQLDARIKSQEDTEFKAFEANFDNQLNNL